MSNGDMTGTKQNTTIDWTAKGRTYAGRLDYDKHLIAYWFDQASDAEVLDLLRGEHADLLAAVRWSALRSCGCEARGLTTPCEVAADHEAEAVRLLVDGFRARLRELTS